jgi:putative acetyltransferase
MTALASVSVMFRSVERNPQKRGVVKSPFEDVFAARVRYYSLMITIRKEKPEDIPGIRYVLVQAFPRDDEAELVDALRRRNVVTLSLVATVDEQITGHVLFTPVRVESPEETFEAIGLAPLAVAPRSQKQGIGSGLVRAGLEELRCTGHDVVFVLGHPDYYTNFGFVSSVNYGIRYEGVVPDNVFLAVELRKGALAGRSGIVKYQPEFGVAGLLEE